MAPGRDPTAGFSYSGVIIGVLSDPVLIYAVVQHWLLATNRDRIAVGLSLSVHPCL